MNTKFPKTMTERKWNEIEEVSSLYTSERKNRMKREGIEEKKRAVF